MLGIDPSVLCCTESQGCDEYFQGAITNEDHAQVLHEQPLHVDVNSLFAK
jgi:hypothetical protein